MTDEQFDRLMWEAMISMGWILPVTPEGVELAERAMENDPLIPSLPDRLKVPPDIERL